MRIVYECTFWSGLEDADIGYRTEWNVELGGVYEEGQHVRRRK